MKILNSIQELWEYLQFCPFCQQSSRPVFIQVGPDDTFDLRMWQKVDTQLFLEIEKNKHITVVSTINCLENTVVFEGDVDCLFDTDNLFFYLQSNCALCESTSVYSCDMDIRPSTITISNIGLEREYLFLKKFSHVLKYYYLEDEMHIMLPGQDIKLPVTEFDFSNKENLIKKINTLIIFS